MTFVCVQERDQRRWNDSDFRCKEGKSSTAALQGHDGISGKIQIGVHRVIFPVLLSLNQRWLSRDEWFSRSVKLLQEQISQAINSVVLLVDKESSQRPERCPGISVSLFTLFILYYDELQCD